ncbi:DUF2200 domain-containing protein [Polaribacter sp.]|nr:DUF2200 domain-containing protein [Polaribacter sp.]
MQRHQLCTQTQQKIKGLICEYHVEDKLMQQIRYLDKLIGVLARGKKMKSILCE